jgi:lysophosphatidic acid acyltransferase/lysophosphatidylinositol acyltransferase
MALPAAIRGVLGMLMLAYIGFIASVGVTFVFLLYLVLRPFSEGTFLRVGCWIQGSFLIHFNLFMDILLGIKLDVRGVMPPAEGALVIPNHLTHDWVPMYMMGYRINTLPYVRTVIKKAVSYIPGLGWGMWALYWPFVSRDFNKDEIVLKKLFGSYERHGLPVQTWLYPEGTRKTAKKLAEAQEYSKANGYAVWNHVMLPRHRGFSLAVNSLKGAVRMIHEVTLAYEGWSTEAPSLWDFMTTDPLTPHVVHVHLTRTPISALPSDDAGKKAWLMDAFARKEELLTAFHKDGAFPGTRQCKDVTVGPMIPHVIGWAVVSVAVCWTLFF